MLSCEFTVALDANLRKFDLAAQTVIDFDDFGGNLEIQGSTGAVDVQQQWFFAA